MVETLDAAPEAVAPRRRRGRRARWVALGLAALLALPAWSFTRTVMRSNGDPFSVKATEWARDHSLGWLVNDVEHYWYAHHQPPKGGLPKGGIPLVAAPARPAARIRAAGRARSQSVIPSCPADRAGRVTRVAARGVVAVRRSQ